MLIESDRTLGVWGMGFGVRAKVAVEESLHDSSLHGFA